MDGDGKEQGWKVEMKDRKDGRMGRMTHRHIEPHRRPHRHIGDHIEETQFFFSFICHLFTESLREAFIDNLYI